MNGSSNVRAVRCSFSECASQLGRRAPMEPTKSIQRAVVPSLTKHSHHLPGGDSPTKFLTLQAFIIIVITITSSSSSSFDPHRHHRHRDRHRHYRHHPQLCQHCSRRHLFFLAQAHQTVSGHCFSEQFREIASQYIFTHSGIHQSFNDPMGAFSWNKTPKNFNFHWIPQSMT